MDKLKTQIRESFFNPLLLVYPVLAFIAASYVVDQYWKCIITLGVVVVITIYVYKAYRRLFKWYSFYALIFLVIAALMCVSTRLVQSGIFATLIDKIIFLVSLLFVFIFRKTGEKISDKLVSPLLPMGNNLSELYKTIKVLISFVAGFLFLSLVFLFVNNSRTDLYLNILKYVYLGILVIYCVFETIKVRIVRSQLVNERWLPIITNEGKVVGTIQRVSSLSDRRRYTYPVIRGVLIHGGKILLQKPVMNDLFYKSEWEIFIAGHISIGETAEDSLKKTAAENFGISDLKTFFLTKYMYETPYEHQYALVFIICNYSGEIIPNPAKIEQLKWWTPQQIENNLNAGIFSEKFIKEYELLKRSGLLDSEEYDCKCNSEEEMVEEEQK